jgi:hypothetical protein
MELLLKIKGGEINLENKVLHGMFESIEPYNSSFKSVKMRIFAFSKNRNLSNITEQSFLLAKSSLYNCPIVSKYIEDETDSFGLDGDLSGHNATLKKTIDKNTGDEIYSIYNDTFPIGLIPNSANIYQEEVNEGTEENPDIKTYVVAEGCLLWMRYDASRKIDEWLNNGIIPKISMEIKILSGVMEENYYKINSFEFEAVCALSSKKEPCFKMAEISNYTKQDFEKSYSEMLKELKELTQLELNQQNQLPSPTLDKTEEVDNVVLNNNINTNFQEEGGNTLEEKLNLLGKYSNLTEEDIKDLKSEIEKYSLEEFDTKLKEMSEVKSNNNSKDNKDGKENKDFEMTNEQMMTAVFKALSERQVATTDYWGEMYQTQEFRYCDIKDNMIITIDYTWSAYYGLPYSVSGDNVEIDFEGKVEYLPDWRQKENGFGDFSLLKDIVAEQIKFSVEKAIQKTQESFSVVESEEYKNSQLLKKLAEDKFSEIEGKYNELQSQFEEIQSKSTILESEKVELQSLFSALESENKELKNFQDTTIASQRKESEDALFEMFSEKLEDEELNPVKEVASTFSLEELEKELYVLVAKKEVKFEKVQKPKVDFSFEKNDVPIKSGKPYDDILEKYVVKQ